MFLLLELILTRFSVSLEARDRTGQSTNLSLSTSRYFTSLGSVDGRWFGMYLGLFRGLVYLILVCFVLFFGVLNRPSRTRCGGVLGAG
jgi:hypothetical protein